MSDTATVINQEEGNDTISLAELDAVIDYMELPCADRLSYKRGTKYRAIRWSTGGTRWKGVVCIKNDIVPIEEFFEGSGINPYD